MTRIAGPLIGISFKRTGWKLLSRFRDIPRPLDNDERLVAYRKAAGDSARVERNAYPWPYLERR